MNILHGQTGRAQALRECIADGCVHAIGVPAALTGAILLVVLAAEFAAAGEVGSVIVYALALLLMLGFSAAYNLWRPSRVKGWLRRLDHSAIFVMIAGTYTPFMTQLRDVGLSIGLGAGVWSGAVAGVALKLLAPGRYDRLSVVLYLALGWSVIVAIGPLVEALPTSAMALLAAGGALYTVGVVFHLWESLPFQNAIWHGFVLAAAGCHYGAVLDCMVLSRT
jgi:hemolysin III